MSALRIALSGSAGTGKTTLGRRLAGELDVPFIEEGMRAKLEAGLDLHALDPAGWQRLMEELWTAQRDEEEQARGGFVSDRSSLDYAAFWLHYGLFDEPATGAWIERMRLEAQRYDRVLLFPWGALPLESDGVRSTNRWVQLRFQTIVEGLLERYLPSAALLRVPPDAGVEERTRSILKQLA